MISFFLAECWTDRYRNGEMGESGSSCRFPALVFQGQERGLKEFTSAVVSVSSAVWILWKTSAGSVIGKNKAVCNVWTEINNSSRKCKVCGEPFISRMLCLRGDLFRWEGKLLLFIFNPIILSSTRVFTQV